MNPDVNDAFVDGLIARLSPLLSQGAVILRGRPDVAGFREDKSGIRGTTPLFVLRPGDVDDVRAACGLAWALAFENGGAAPVAVVARGGGTGLCGGAVPTGPSIVLDMTAMDRVGDVRSPEHTIFAQPGVSIGRLESCLSGSGLFFPVTPTGAAESATVGGVLSTNARGMYATLYGCAADNVTDLQVVLPDGSLADIGHGPLHSSAGLNMVELFVGAEGTLGVITGATLKLHPRPGRIGRLYMEFDSVPAAAEGCAFMVDAVQGMAACEILSRETIGFIRRAFPDCGYPDCGALVMLEIHNGPDQPQTDSTGFHEWWLDDILARGGVRTWRPRSGFDPWEARHRVSSVISESSENGVPVRFDCAVEIGRFSEYVAMLQEKAGREGFRDAVAIFGHAGLGIVHVLIPVGVGDRLCPPGDAEEFRLWAIDRAIALGGTVSGEHGVGMVLVEQAERENQGSIGLARRLKQMIDPYGIMNPGKVFR